MIFLFILLCFSISVLLSLSQVVAAICGVIEVLMGAPRSHRVAGAERVAFPATRLGTSLPIQGGSLASDSKAYCT